MHFLQNMKLILKFLETWIVFISEIVIYVFINHLILAITLLAFVHVLAYALNKRGQIIRLFSKFYEINESVGGSK